MSPGSLRYLTDQESTQQTQSKTLEPWSKEMVSNKWQNNEAAKLPPLWRSRLVTDGQRITRLCCVTKPLHSRRSSTGLRPDGIICLTPWPRLWNATNTFSGWLQAKSYLLLFSCIQEHAFHKLVLNHQSRWILDQWLVGPGTCHISSTFIRQK